MFVYEARLPEDDFTRRTHTKKPNIICLVIFFFLSMPFELDSVSDYSALLSLAEMEPV